MVASSVHQVIFCFGNLSQDRLIYRMIHRNRLYYTLLIVLTLIVGLASRKVPDLFPPFLATYLGDTLWALLLGHGFLWSDCLCYTVGIGVGYGMEKGYTFWLK